MRYRYCATLIALLLVSLYSRAVDLVTSPTQLSPNVAVNMELLTDDDIATCVTGMGYVQVDLGEASADGTSYQWASQSRKSQSGTMHAHQRGVWWRQPAAVALPRALW